MSIAGTQEKTQNSIMNIFPSDRHIFGDSPIGRSKNSSGKSKLIRDTDNIQDRELRDAIQETGERTGLDFDHFDRLKVENLPEGTLAQTRQLEKNRGQMKYFKTILLADPDLLSEPKHIQTHVLLHENVHGMHFQDKLYEKLTEEGIGREDSGTLRELIGQSGDIREGATEFITHLLDPESQKVGKKFYRDEMNAVEEILEGETNLTQDIRTSTREPINKYREIYDIDSAEGLYIEDVKIAGEGLSTMISGDGPEVYVTDASEQYLIEDEYKSNQDYRDFLSDVHLDRGILDDDPSGDYMTSIQENRYLEA